MKKSSFAAMVLGTVSVVLFALGMCMALIPEWNAFKPGVIFGCAGLIFGLITLIVWRRMEHKEPIRIDGKDDPDCRYWCRGCFGIGSRNVLEHGLGQDGHGRWNRPCWDCCTAVPAPSDKRDQGLKPAQKAMSWIARTRTGRKFVSSQRYRIILSAAAAFASNLLYASIPWRTWCSEPLPLVYRHVRFLWNLSHHAVFRDLV